MRAQDPCAASLRMHARLRCDIKLVMMQRGPLLILSLWFCIGVHAQVGFKTTLSASGIEYLKVERWRGCISIEGYDNTRGTP